MLVLAKIKNQEMQRKRLLLRKATGIQRHRLRALFVGDNKGNTLEQIFRTIREAGCRMHTVGGCMRMIGKYVTRVKCKSGQGGSHILMEMSACQCGWYRGYDFCLFAPECR